MSFSRSHRQTAFYPLIPDGYSRPVAFLTEVSNSAGKGTDFHVLNGFPVAYVESQGIRCDILSLTFLFPDLRSPEPLLAGLAAQADDQDGNDKSAENLDAAGTATNEQFSISSKKLTRERDERTGECSPEFS